jgi:hypothetical protein
MHPAESTTIYLESIDWSPRNCFGPAHSRDRGEGNWHRLASSDRTRGGDRRFSVEEERSPLIHGELNDALLVIFAEESEPRTVTV